MRTGIVVATKAELEPFLKAFGRPSKQRAKEGGLETLKWEISPENNIFLIQSGIGEKAAEDSTQFLINNYRVDRVINYGAAGGLADHQKRCKAGIVREVIFYGPDVFFGGEQSEMRLTPQKDAFFDLPVKGFPEYVCASANKIVGGGKAKRELRQKYEADICDMEAAGVVIACNRNNIPCSLIKAISDNVDEDEAAFERYVTRAAKNCVKFLVEIINK